MKVLNFIKSLFGNAIFYCIITILFFIGAFTLFTWNMINTFSTNLPIDHAIWGQFEDFVGGTLEVIFSLISVMLVVWTFRVQNKTAETQRFNDLFFELLNLHHEQEKLLKYKERLCTLPC